MKKGINKYSKSLNFKLFFIVFILINLITISNAQPCKTIKLGMSRPEVLKLIGVSDSISPVYLINDDTLDVWNYGNQQVIFFGSKGVTRIVFNVKSENRLNEEYRMKKISLAQFEKQLKRINKHGCK